ncbi:MAG: valine--tRNA ligase [Chloroflexi bacterium]|nr:valine--tRNA ligase [Chloroflexota bacterium]
MSTAEGARTTAPAPETAGLAELPRTYEPAAFEAAIYEHWAAADVFAPDGAGSRADWSKPAFVIVMPPPNVTGALHLGHAARVSIEDAMTRQARMMGRPTLWLPGVDHASIAAQYVLDQILATEGESRASLGRDRYLERMWRFMDETRDVISTQQRRLGASADWSRLRFTMDDGSARAVRTAFKRLHDAGLAYREEALINWCPGCRTSLSDLEVIGTPQRGTLWFVRYHLSEGEDGIPDPDAWITVATTRPETILGDTAVAVNPDDPRYRELIGRRVIVPFVDRPVPIIADEVVEQSFGTGAVKITPAHDHDDNATGRRHGLAMVNVLDDEGRITEAGGPYAGLDRFEARERILRDLEARGDLAESRAHEMVIGRCQRSDDVVEPRLKTQWFVRTAPLAAKAMAAVRERRVRFVPERFEKVFFNWMENIHDWNLSRQLWWGHRIPAWYCSDGHATVTDSEAGPDACSTCARPAAQLTRDPDIFDTWFSSGLWPFSTLGWPEQTEDLSRFYPGTVMETGYDIIFFWVARMMMLGQELIGREPFSTVYLAGLVRDPHGQKMSKTKGTGIDPLEVIGELGADALRFALVNGITPGNDQRLGREKLEGARNFANKLWNAARFVLSVRPTEMDSDQPLRLPDRAAMGPAEHWVLDRCAATIEEVSRAYTVLHLGEATRLLHEAIWSEFCDWYIEISKARLASGAPVAERIATWQTLTWVLDRYLRLLHPTMPFVTEALWQRLPREEASPSAESDRGQAAELLIIASWPDGVAERAVVDPETAASTGRLLDLVRAVRNARSENRIEPSVRLRAVFSLDDPGVRSAYEELAEPIARLARLEPETSPDVAGDGTITVVAPGAVVRLAPAVDRTDDGRPDRERARLKRELSESRQLLQAAQARLANDSFVSRAPAAIVDGARRREAELAETVRRLESRLGG